MAESKTRPDEKAENVDPSVSPLHSIIVPVYNSRDSFPNLVKRLAQVMQQAALQYELILVDDGSVDGVFELIREAASQHSYIRAYRLSRNFGHQAALLTGLEKSKGDYIAIIDDDLQDPPEVLPVFFEKLHGDLDVVYGLRRKRKEGIIKRAMFSAFYRILRVMSHVEIPADTGDFCAMRRCVVDAMLRMYDAYPYLRGIRAWVGFRQAGVEYERSARETGESGYTMRAYFKLAITGIVMFSTVPLRLGTYVGLFASCVSLLYALFLVAYWLINPFDVPGFLTLIVVISFLGGVQLLCIGLVGEYVGRLLDNVRRWPTSIIAESAGENA